MLGDFNNTEAVQGDLIKGDDVITEPWLRAILLHRAISAKSVRTHIHTHPYTHIEEMDTKQNTT